MNQPDHLDADSFSALGGQPVWVVEAAAWRRPSAPIQALVIGVDRAGVMPTVVADDFDLLLTSSVGAPQPWVSIERRVFDAQVERLVAAASANPLAATITAQVLRLAEKLTMPDALAVESLAYSSLLGGGEFARWRSATTVGAESTRPSVPIIVERMADQISLTLNDPAERNAMSAAMRDALYEALANALDDPTRPEVMLRGAGKCFSTGGALSEFGTAQDLAEAHAVRTLHSCARALDALGPQASVRLHGACVGSGIEVAAAAHRRIAAPDTWFQLPELSMGLMPGAGGTATISKAIGRHRTLWMILSGKKIGVGQALRWGLIHAIDDRP